MNPVRQLFQGEETCPRAADRVLRTGSKALALVLLLGAFGCSDLKVSPLSEDLPQAVAHVGDATISLEEFEAELERRSRSPGWRSGSSEEKARVLDEMIQQEVLYQRARQAGYETHEAVQAALKRLMIQKFQADQLAKFESRAGAIQETDVEEYYFSNPDEFHLPERRRGAVIFIGAPFRPTEEASEAFRRRMEDLRAEALRLPGNPGEAGDFARLVQRHSEDQGTRHRGGDMGWLENRASARWPEPVVQALFRLGEPGAISPAIAAPNGWYLVRLTDRMASAQRPLDEARETIRFRLEREREQLARQHFLTSQRGDIPVRIDQALLERARVESDAPPLISGGIGANPLSIQGSR